MANHLPRFSPCFVLTLIVLFGPSALFAAPSAINPRGPAECSEMESWDYGMAMCMPRPMADMPMRMAMFRYNSFLVQTVEEGRRGRTAFSVPNMFMADVGSSVGNHHYVNLDYMGTLERWTIPNAGYPLIFQIGEEDRHHRPFLDAQHPHSSPVMGLTLSDTFTLGPNKNLGKIWFAPRGESTDGPIAFMHRPTGWVNPDAPLGHHIGQDVGHITGTVFGASIRIVDTTLEISTFNGQEPEPTKVDLPIARPNSYAARLTQQFGPHLYAMSSAAFVKDPESDDPDLDHVWRYSASLYADQKFGEGWRAHGATIWGLINFYDRVPALNSFTEELWLSRKAQNFWGRFEILQRSRGQLQIADDLVSGPRWVEALSLGYTYDVYHREWLQIGIGASVTKNFVPAAWRATYDDPLAGKLFVQLSGTGMSDI